MTLNDQRTTPRIAIATTASSTRASDRETERLRRVRRTRRAITVPGTNSGSFAPTSRPEAVDLNLVSAPTAEHSMAHLGIITTFDEQGALVARNTNGTGPVCPHCRAADGTSDKARQARCEHCAGRGYQSDVPFCDRQWDLIVEDRLSGGQLFLGGHDCQPDGGGCQPGATFDLVVSLYRRPGYDPADGVEHLSHTMIDGPLSEEDVPIVDFLATRVAERHRAGDRILVRCQAGMNRSGLVAAIAMVKLGWDPDAAIERMRAARSPWVLFNQEFVEHIRSYRNATGRSA